MYVHGIVQVHTKKKLIITLVPAFATIPHVHIHVYVVHMYMCSYTCVITRSVIRLCTYIYINVYIYTGV